ncbi:MAG TPA: SRPBCC domain-containing protein [Vicinamibacterales bacterium]|nr:SRPBCC domain-containing protein [Vicinamibacterales bacterium]
MTTSTLLFTLDRTVTIRATPETVFGFFTDNTRWASWWGEGSTIEPRPGGRVFIRYPGGVEASGEVLEIEEPDRLVFTYGFMSGTPIPPGSSRVTIRLAPHKEGTHLALHHEFADEAARNEHVQGWRYQLSLFANAVANEAHAHATEAIDLWFSAWSITEENERRSLLGRIAGDAVTFRDRFSALEGLSELVPHIAAAQRFMPGLRLERKGPIRQCQGTALVDWIAVSTDGQQRAAGVNVFTLSAAGRIEAVTGFWNP